MKVAGAGGRAGVAVGVTLPVAALPGPRGCLARSSKVCSASLASPVTVWFPVSRPLPGTAVQSPNALVVL